MRHLFIALLITSPAMAITLTVHPPAGYHFNTEAPAPSLSAGSVSKLGEREAVLSVPDGTKSVTVRWFVCADGKPVCTVVREELGIEGDKVTGRKPAVAASGKGDAPSIAPVAAGGTSHGFLVDRPDEALAQAKKERRPLIIDFFGIWCPPCNMLDETVFSRPEFVHAAEPFVKVKLDADRETSWALKEKYKVGGYPTIVFATPGGDEIDRIVGSRPLAAFVARVEDALAHQAQPLTVLRERAKSGDGDAVWRLSRIQVDAGDVKPAMRRMQRYVAEHDAKFSDEQRELIARAEVGTARQALEDAADPKAARAEYLATLQSALKQHPGCTDALDWASALAGLREADKDAAGAKAAWQQVIDISKALEGKKDQLARDGAMRADLLQQRAEAYQALGDEAKMREAFAEAAADYAREVADAGLSPATARGFNIERAFCLGKAGKPDEADALYTQLEKSYPDEFTFLFAHAGLMHSQKKLDRAEDLATRALKVSYGDNRLRAAERLAKVLRDENKAGEANAVLASALGEAKKPSDPHNRTHRYIAALEKLKDELATAK